MRNTLLTLALAAMIGLTASAFADIRTQSKTIVGRTVGASRAVRYPRLSSDPMMQLKRIVFRILGIGDGGEQQD
ncbi:MAG: hypothetical protein JSS66_00015 [Armatimonadetes bacterium]|nr:hypothetical protein [Armatimonadota bacterium]